MRCPTARRGPLSPSQHSLWLLEQSGAAGIYHNIMAVECRGPLDREALAGALNSVIARHESLRTRFVTDRSEVTQEVLTTWAVPVEHLRPAGSYPEALSRARAWAGLPFSFGANSAPPLRASLSSAGPDRELLVLVAHHLISDGDSMTIILRELFEAYEARVNGHPDPLGVPPAQFLDVAGPAGEPATASDIAFWREHLAGAPAVLDLPLDRLRPRQPSYRGAVCQRAFDPRTIAAVRELARAERVSVFMVILASLAVLLTRLAGADEVVIGVPVSLRRDHASRGTVGYLVNTIALRIAVSEEATVRELLAQVRRATLRGYDRSRVPFSSVVRELRPARRLDHHPVYQVLCAFTDRGNSAAEQYARPVAGLELAFPVVEPPKARADISFCVHEVAGTLAVDVEYAADLCDEPTAAALAEALESLLASGARDPSRLARTLPMTAARPPETDGLTHVNPAFREAAIEWLLTGPSPLRTAKRVLLAGDVSSATASVIIAARAVAAQETIVGGESWASLLRGDGSETVVGTSAALLEEWVAVTRQAARLAGIAVIGEPPLPQPWKKLVRTVGDCPVSYIGGPAELGGIAVTADVLEAKCVGRVIGHPLDPLRMAVADAGGPVPDRTAGVLRVLLPGAGTPVPVCRARVGDGGVIEMTGLVTPASAPLSPPLCQLEGTIATIAGAADVHAGWRHGVHGPRLVVEVVAEPGTSLTAQEVRERLSEHLAAHLVPETVTIAPRLPEPADGWLTRARGSAGPGRLGARLLDALTE